MSYYINAFIKTLKRFKGEKHYEPKLSPAVSRGDIFLVQELLKDGADPNISEPYGFYPLHLAAWSFHEMIKYLIYGGALVNQINCDGNTCLHLVFGDYNRSYERVKILLENGANCNIKNNLGSIPLHNITDETEIETVKLLVEAGSRLDAVNNEGLTPFDVVNRELEKNKFKSITVQFFEVVTYLEEATRKYKLKKIVILLLCIRTFIDDSTLYKDYLPLDTFKEIIGLVLKK